MKKLQALIASKKYLATIIAIALGIALSHLHDASQSLLMPLGSWAREAFLIDSQSPTIPTTLVNLAFQFVCFGVASLCVLLPMSWVLTVQGPRYPVITFLAYMVYGLWWIPIGLIFGFGENTQLIAPLIPFLLIAAVAAYSLTAYVVFGRSVLGSARISRFEIIRVTLWLALAGAISFSFLSRFSTPSVAVLAAVIVSLAYWLLRHSHALRNKNAEAEAQTAIPDSYDPQIRAFKPRRKDFAAGLSLLGLVGYFFAYEAAHGNEPTTSIARLAYRIAGPTGAVFFLVLAATVLLSVGVESILGSRKEKP